MQAARQEDLVRLLAGLALEAMDHYGEHALHWWEQLKERNRRMRELDGYADAPRTYISYVPEPAREEAPLGVALSMGCGDCGAEFHLISPTPSGRACRVCRAYVDADSYN